MRAQVVIAAGVVALAVTACGGSGSHGNGVAGRSPDAIVAAARQAMDGVRTVHVTGSLPDGAQPIRLDLNLVNGRGASGTMSEGGQSFRLIAVGGTLYIDGSAGFWRQFGGAAAAARLNGRWLRAPQGAGKLASLGSLTDVRRLIAALLTGHGTLTRAGTSTVDGRRVVALRDASRSGTLYVATAGPAYAIRIANTGSEGGRLDFTDFDANVTLTAPASSVALPGLTR